MAEELVVPGSKKVQVDRLVEACVSATTRDDQLEALRGLKEELLQESCREVTKQRAVTAILEQMTLNAQLGAGVAEATTAVLDAAGWTACLAASVATLRSLGSKENKTATSQQSTSAITLQNTLTTVKRVLCSPDVTVVPRLNGQANDKEESIARWMRPLVEKTIPLLPQLLSNACLACKVQLPQWTIPSIFFPRILLCGLRRMVQCTNSEDILPWKIFVLLLTKRLAGKHSVTEVTKGFMEALEWSFALEEPADAPQPSKIETTLAEGLHSMSPNNAGLLLLSMIQYIQVHDTTMLRDFCKNIFPPYLSQSLGARQAFIEQAAFGPPSRSKDANLDRELCAQIASLVHLAGDLVNEEELLQNHPSNAETSLPFCRGDRLVRNHLAELLQTWNTERFVLSTDATEHRHVTRMILAFFAVLKSKEEPIESAIAPMVLPGVTNRLESTNPSIRDDGMRVANILGQRLGQEKVFPDVEDELPSETRVNQDVLNESLGPLTAIPPSENLTPASDAPKRAVKKPSALSLALDPDAEYVSSDEETDNASAQVAAENMPSNDIETDSDLDDDSVWATHDNLVPYNLEDDEEDLQIARKPIYLRDCLRMLRVPESEEDAFAQHDVAMHALSELVRSRPLDLPDIATSIALQLLSMENKFNLEDFGEVRALGLTSLVVEEPSLVGHRLITELFNDDMALQERLQILSTLQNGALELCERIVSPTVIEGRSPTTAKRIEGEVATSNQISKLELKTRRIRSRAKPVRVIQNRLSPVGAGWFYAMVSGFVKSRENKNIWTGFVGSQLLANLFVTLSCVVDCMGDVPGIQLLASDLFDLTWRFSDADVAEVRRAVLISCATAIVRMEEAKLTTILAANGPAGSPLRQLASMARLDPDQDCRKLATALSQSAIDILDANSTPMLRESTSRGRL